MLDIDFEPEMVGREENLEELQAYLEMASDGFGSTILLSGEAGIGKTRLIEEIRSDAQSKGFQVLSGYSLYESLTPYMPFTDALRSGRLDYLFAEQSPMVEGVYLVTKTGLLIREVIREETELDPDLFASMLTTVGNFVRDTLTQLKGDVTLESLNKLGYGDHTILIESGESTYLAAIITGEENEFLVNDMRDSLTAVDRRFGKVLEKWDGNEDKVKGIGGILNQLISSGKYDGVFYGRDDPKSRRNLLFENVSLGLQRQSQMTPTLLCLEDLQWADPSSLALMHYVARNTRKCKLLILGTYRPEDILVKEGEYHPLVDTMQLMSREELYKRLDLGRLPEESMTEFMSAILGRVGFGEEFQSKIYTETEGNPLYIIELTKLLIDEGILENSEGTWVLSKGWEEVNIPSKICDVIVRRLNRVETGDRRVLDYASVMGDVFRSETLSGALKLEKVQLLERLKVLEKHHKLVHAQNGVFRFDHAKVREVLYSEMPNELRMEYHAIVADSIESLNSENLDEVIGDLAFHYYHCRNKEKAPAFLVRAAEKAMEEYSNDEAIRFFTEAVDVEDDDDKSRAILEKLGSVYELIGDLDNALKAYNDALNLAREDRAKAAILSSIGGIYEYQGEYDKAIGTYTKALDLVRGEGSREEALAITGIGIVQWSLGEYDKALEYYTNALEIMRSKGDERGIANNLNNLGNFYVQRGDFRQALDNYRESLVIRESTGDQRGAAHAVSNIGAVHLHKGEYDDALNRFRETLQILDRIGDQLGIAYSLNNIGVIHEDRGEYEEALDNYRRSLELVEKIGDQQVVASTLHNIGLIYKYTEKYDMALEQYKKSLEICEKIGLQVGMAFNFCAIAEAHFMKNELEEAMDFCRLGLKLSEEIDVKEYISDSKRILGMVFREMSRWEEAAKSFKESVDICKEIGREKELGKSYYEFGLMWAQKGDFENARANLDRSIDIFQKLELEKELQSAKKALSDLS
jgi:predicted ATPase